MIYAVKTDDDSWMLDVLGVPFGGPFDGKDHDGEFFDQETQLWLDQIGKRPIVHYHGYNPDGQPANEPEIIGQEISHEIKDDGVWFRVVLDKTKDAAQRIWDAAMHGMARASSGALQHLVRRDDNGHIAVWPMGELSLMDINSGNYPANPYAVALPVLQKRFKAAGLELTINEMVKLDVESSSDAEPSITTNINSQENPKMTDELKPLTLEDIAAYLDRREADKAEAARVAALEAQAEELKSLKTQIAEAQAQRAGTEQIRKMPNPVVEDKPVQISVNSKWDGFTVGQLGLAYEMLKATGHIPSAELYRSLHAKALKTIDSPDFYANHLIRDDRGNVRREFSPTETEAAVRAVKAINPMQLADTPAVKANELMYSTYSNHGDQWVPAMWSPELWDLVRNGADVMSRFRQVEVPGESLTIPTLAGKTTLYKTAQSTDQSDLTAAAANATLSKATTSNVTLTPVKGTAWVVWSGELDEDSIVPMLPSIQAALQQDLMEQIDEILISGDSDTANTNISDTGNAGISATWYLLIADGLRDHALGNTNTVDIGALDATKFISVLRKLGTNGVNALKPQNLFWVFDPGSYHTALALGETLTAEKTGRGVGSFEDGLLTRLYGSPIVVSDRYGKTDSNGKIHNTVGNNTKGSFVVVRPDRWLLGFGRRITLEALPRDRDAIISDTNGLFASFRMDFKANGTGGAALGYNVTLIG